MLKNFRRVNVLRKYFNTKIFTTAFVIAHGYPWIALPAFSRDVHVRRGKRKKRTDKVTAMEEFFERNCCIQGYHAIKKYGRRQWRVGGVRKRPRKSDRYAVAVIKEGTIIGHLPRKVSRVCSLFLQRGSTVTGRRKYSADLAQSGLEVPALFLSRQRRNL